MQSLPATPIWSWHVLKESWGGEWRKYIIGKYKSTHKEAMKTLVFSVRVESESTHEITRQATVSATEKSILYVWIFKIRFRFYYVYFFCSGITWFCLLAFIFLCSLNVFPRTILQCVYNFAGGGSHCTLGCDNLVFE